MTGLDRQRRTRTPVSQGGLPRGAQSEERHYKRGRRRRFRRLIGFGLVAVMIVGLGLGGYIGWPRPLDSKTVCFYSGSVSSLETFSKLVGAQVNCTVAFNDANPGWTQWVDPWFTHPAPTADTDWSSWIKADPAVRRVVVTQEMVPDNVPANWRVLGAEGAYDGYARKLATNLVRAGMGNAIIRLGHEMNGTWYHDSLGSNPARHREWAEYWARIVRAMRSVTGAHFLFDWNVNAGYRDIQLSSFYPGNDVVDMIGIDIYDAGMPGNPSNQASRWTSFYREPDGPEQVVAFARAHRKPLSIPEWGLVSKARGGSGDDPSYVRGIVAAINDNNVVYQSYFDHTTSGVLKLEGCPASLSLWKQYFGKEGGLSGRPW
jgi:hypothetical protein